MVFTIFSAANYCNKYKNKGAIIILHNNDFDIQQYNHIQGPFYLPNFQNVIKWSIPFISEKLMAMNLSIFEHLKNLEDKKLASDKYLDALKDLEDHN